MSELKKSYTQIIETARQQLGISRDEYALCSYIQYRAADPRQRISGWCCDEKEEIAVFVGVTRAGLYKMAERLILDGLLEPGGSIPFAWRVTPKWIDIESQCKQSLHDGVNKVDTRRKQSLHDGVNKVDTHIKVEYELENNEVGREEKEAASPFFPPAENSETVKAEKKEKSLQNGAAGETPLLPPFTLTGETIEPKPATLVRMYDPKIPAVTIVDSVPATYETTQNPRETPPDELHRVNIPVELERLKTDAAAKETFALVRKIPSKHFLEYVEAFGREIGGTGETYSNPRAFRKHFFNWSSKKWEIEQRKTIKQTGKNGSHITHTGGDLSKYEQKQVF